MLFDTAFVSNVIANIVGTFVGAILSIAVAVWASRRERSLDHLQEQVELLKPVDLALDSLEELIRSDEHRRIQRLDQAEKAVSAVINAGTAGRLGDAVLNGLALNVLSTWNACYHDIRFAAGAGRGHSSLEQQPNLAEATHPLQLVLRQIRDEFMRQRVWRISEPKWWLLGMRTKTRIVSNS